MNPREIDVISILFDSDTPMTATEITYKKKELTQSTVTAVLRKLLGMQYVEVTGTTHSGKVLSRMYRATDKAKEGLLEYILCLYDSVKSIIPPEEMCRIIRER